MRGLVKKLVEVQVTPLFRAAGMSGVCILGLEVVDTRQGLVNATVEFANEFVEQAFRYGYALRLKEFADVSAKFGVSTGG